MERDEKKKKPMELISLQPALFPFSLIVSLTLAILFLSQIITPPNRNNMEVDYREDYVKNSRGVHLFTCRWLPRSSSPKALVFLCHAYGLECSRSMKACATALATSGFGVYGLDYEGHGRSMGARCYIRNFENIVSDCDIFFKSICDQEGHRKKSRFLYGESMGGAVALLLHRKDANFWDGAVLVAPMCKISEKVLPHRVVVKLFTQLFSPVQDLIPKWKIVPTKDVINSGFKDPIKREMVRRNIWIYHDKPRLKTALELLRASTDIEEHLFTVQLPFLVLHGEADMVTDPEVSRALYQRAGSSDKTIKLYPGMWHALTAGEPDENVELVLGDIIAWLNERSINWSCERVCVVAADELPSPSSSKSCRKGKGLFGGKGRSQYSSI